MDWSLIISELGGGFDAVVIIALAWWGWSERKEAKTAYESRLTREKEVSQQLTDTILAVESVGRLLRGSN